MTMKPSQACARVVRAALLSSLFWSGALAAGGWAVLRRSAEPGVRVAAATRQSEAPSGQDAQTLPSPPATADVRLDGREITVGYNSPSARGRKIMGGVVPYGQVWRTGANPATRFTTEADLMVGTLRVPAGKYTLYTLPGTPGTPWKLILSKQTGQWGTVYNADQDLGRTDMRAGTLPEPQEVMSLTFQDSTMHATQLHVKWERTDEWVEIRAAR